MYKYVGHRSFWPGVPMRDLTDEEWDALPESAKKGAKKLYKKALEKKAKDDAPQKDDTGGSSK